MEGNAEETFTLDQIKKAFSQGAELSSPLAAKFFARLEGASDIQMAEHILKEANKNRFLNSGLIHKMSRPVKDQFGEILSKQIDTAINLTLRNATDLDTYSFAKGYKLGMGLTPIRDLL